jgi:DNA-directed RNA polymerase subunit M/transcription elongation factor TFIIS
MSQLTINNPSEFRKNIRFIIKDILANEAENIDEPTFIKIYTNIEIALFNYSIQKAKQQKGVVVKWEIPAFVQIYTDHLRTILYNLDNNNEEINIKQQLINGNISSKDFVFMSHQEWAPSIWKTYIEEKIKKDNMKYNKKVQSSTDMFICKKCHNNKCTYYEMQTRSADESATIFVNCLTCGKNWRE